MMATPASRTDDHPRGGPAGQRDSESFDVCGRYRRSPAPPCAMNQRLIEEEKWIYPRNTLDLS
jgi:hypothetical protein